MTHEHKRRGIAKATAPSHEQKTETNIGLLTGHLLLLSLDHLSNHLAADRAGLS